MPTRPHEQPGDPPRGSLYRRTVSRRAMLLSTGGAVAALGTAGCASGSDTAGTAATTPAKPPTDVYFGYVFGRPEITAVAFDVDPPAADGARTLRAYVCDGLGIPVGLALWFTGTVDPAQTEGLNTVVPLPSASGEETLEIGNFTDYEIRGTFIDSTGGRFRYMSNPATAGAGIYQVTVTPDLTYSGTSTAGDELAGKLRDGVLTGTLTTWDGKQIPLLQEVLALATPARLAAFGNTGAAREWAANSAVPGEYVAVLSPGGTAAFGRSGNVRKGSPGGDIIGLDKAD
ncbi:hypothetical protein [Pseudonocardia sp.]|uniref:hypothetical protein n=1 Tax=Pseudonocardia sp. TaxID=60912 RepID=UPI003D105339